MSVEAEGVVAALPYAVPDGQLHYVIHQRTGTVSVYYSGAQWRVAVSGGERGAEELRRLKERLEPVCARFLADFRRELTPPGLRGVGEGK